MTVKEMRYEKARALKDIWNGCHRGEVMVVGPSRCSLCCRPVVEARRRRNPRSFGRRSVSSVPVPSQA
jgi:hypothetical protein